MCNFWSSFLQYALYVDWHTHCRRKAPKFQEKDFFGQLHRILVLELLQAPPLALAEWTTVILALVHEVKATCRDSIYYYTEFGPEEVVDLKTIRCVVGRIQDRGEWAIIDRSDGMALQTDWSAVMYFFFHPCLWILARAMLFILPPRNMTHCACTFIGVCQPLLPSSLLISL